MEEFKEIPYLEFNEDHLKLSGLMQDLSEECYAASWCDGFEFELWEVLTSTSKGRCIGRELIDFVDLAKLEILANRFNCWFYCNPENGDFRAVSLKDWQVIYAPYEEQKRKKVKNESL